MTWVGSARKDRLPPGWPALRRQILERDGFRCHVCGGFGADEVDHVRPGDNHHPSNLAAIHARPCHSTKSAGEGGQANARKWRRAPTPHPGMRVPTTAAPPASSRPLQFAPQPTDDPID